MHDRIVLKFNIGNRHWSSEAKTDRLSANCQNPSIGATLPKTNWISNCLQTKMLWPQAKAHDRVSL